MSALKRRLTFFVALVLVFLYITVYHGKKSRSPPPVISLASAVCSKPGDNGPKEEAVVLLKSILISKIMYSIPNKIEYHLFTEHEADQSYFQSAVTAFGFDESAMSLHFHAAVPNPPPNPFIYDDRYRCMYIRLFLSALLNTDSVLYLDTDVIVTGSILDFWSYLTKMNNEQLLGIIPDFDVSNPKRPLFFKTLPFPPPKGLNAGIVLMNLTKMREYKFTEKINRIHNDYYPANKDIDMNDQHLLNILLYFDSGLFMEMPCQFNFWASTCFSDIYCPGAEEDPVGIQVIHGAGENFEEDYAFWNVFDQYRKFILSRHTTLEDLTQNLMAPIKMRYKQQILELERKKQKSRTKRRAKTKGFGKCGEAVEKYLFKSFL